MIMGGKSAYDVLHERGFIEQVTDEESIMDLLERENITCYIGFDPTAASLHIGSLVPIMSLMHMQRCGHKPIVLVGGGTGLIGDPSGKTEMRCILTRDEIDTNAEAIKKQLSQYLDFKEDRALLLNNADWLAKLNYLEFLRDIGCCFSVNRMLAAESCRARLEKGLSFIEFNYMLLQSYDFYYLCRNYGCILQMGGNDQWGNIVAGIDLTRRLKDKKTYGITFPLLTTSQGHKMGKTEKGTVWLDAGLTTPYDYFQYWINTEDLDVVRFLALFTLLPMEEVKEAEKLVDSELNMAKAVLAFEATRITHGQDAAVAAWGAAVNTFGLKPVSSNLFPSSSIPRSNTEVGTSAIPTVEKSMDELERGVSAFEFFHDVGLCKSRGEARRLITQGGAYVNGLQVGEFDEKIGTGNIDKAGEIHLRKGKKQHIVIKVS
ncbi:MAG: tyrosine--tRNA ligase [Thermodesulfobacteriota bacterium]|nr:tyrosine--tRNA ligase [Thermodesulfobacteriota bacterium]